LAFEEASLYLTAVLHAERVRPPAALAGVVLERIRNDIARQEQPRSRFAMMRAPMIAAACLLLIAGVGWYYYMSKVTVATGNAQQQLVILPDHSTVMLNANSTLSYYRAYGWHAKAVWLQGEALFDIRHSAQAPFTAHAGKLLVQVLGTRFTIRERRSKVSVALLEGRVSIRDGEGGQPLELRPGEAVNYEDTVMRLSPIGRLSNQPQAWVDKSIRANGMTVQDIIDTYEDTYGYKIILGDPVQAGKKIDGSLSLETEDGVLYTLANILNANIHRQGKIIYLNPK
jgi:ferric-dicitrate binding protein FerR (iron transport regulator)